MRKLSLRVLHPKPSRCSKIELDRHNILCYIEFVNGSLRISISEGWTSEILFQSDALDDSLLFCPVVVCPYDCMRGHRSGVAIILWRSYRCDILFIVERISLGSHRGNRISVEHDRRGKSCRALRGTKRPFRVFFCVTRRNCQHGAAGH